MLGPHSSLSNSSLSHSPSSLGDVIVYINDICVLGTTHADVVKLFQSVPIGQSVTLMLCRGYHLPYDPEDPSAAAAAAAAASALQPMGLVEHPAAALLINGRSSYDNYMEYMSLTGRLGPDQGTPIPHPGDTHLDGSQPPSLNAPSTSGAGPHEDSVSMASSGTAAGAGAGAGQGVELLSIAMVKGAEGFGFTIADSPTGQRVKQVLEAQGCPGLCEGDHMVEFNQQGLQGLNHTQVVQLLKDCPVGTEATLVIQRGTTVTGERLVASVRLLILRSCQISVFSNCISVKVTFNHLISNSKLYGVW